VKARNEIQTFRNAVTPYRLDINTVHITPQAVLNSSHLGTEFKCKTENVAGCKNILLYR